MWAPPTLFIWLIILQVDTQGKKKACFHCSKTDLCSFVHLHHNWKKCSKIDIFLWFAVKKKSYTGSLRWSFYLKIWPCLLFTSITNDKLRKRSRIFPLHWVFATDVYIITASDTAIIKLCKVLITLFYSLAIKGWWGYCCHPAGKRGHPSLQSAITGESANMGFWNWYHRSIC